jgi:hypothetical protein
LASAPLESQEEVMEQPEQVSSSWLRALKLDARASPVVLAGGQGLEAVAEAT